MASVRGNAAAKGGLQAPAQSVVNPDAKRVGQPIPTRAQLCAAKVCILRALPTGPLGPPHEVAHTHTHRDVTIDWAMWHIGKKSLEGIHD